MEEAGRVRRGHLLQQFACGIFRLPSKRVPELQWLNTFSNLHKLPSRGDNGCQIVCQLVFIIIGALKFM